MKFKKDIYQINKILNQDFINSLSYSYFVSVKSSEITKFIKDSKDECLTPYAYDIIRNLLKERNKERQYIKKRLKELESYNFILSFYSRIYKTSLSLKSDFVFRKVLEYLRIKILEIISKNVGFLKEANRDINNLHRMLLSEDKKVFKKIKSNVELVKKGSEILDGIAENKNASLSVDSTKGTTNLKDRVTNIELSLEEIMNKINDLQEMIISLKQLGGL